MKISDRVILPLVGSAFQPGKAAEAIEKIEDKELAQIAQGEYYFFSAQAERCVETIKDYLDHDDVMLRLSADMLYTFANLTLGDSQAAQHTREDVHQCLTRAWERARADKFMEPFIEYHGLLQGTMEVCIRKKESEMYKKLVDGVLAFSRGWMKIHNPKTQKAVTDLLTPLEYSIAMLACRDWTNQEIAEHMGMSVNTVKHYVSGILEKLQIDKRDKIKEFVNQ